MTRFPRIARLLAAASVTALAVGAFGGAAPLADAVEIYPRPASGVLTLVGRGYGHGRGMSQYGAMSAATRGQTWQQIIDFYYPNTTRLSGFTGTIRVGVQSTTGMTVRVAMETGLTALSADGKVKVALPAKVGDIAVWSWQVAVPDDTTNTSGVALRARLANGTSVQVYPTISVSWTFSTPDGTLTAMTSAGAKVATYLGTFRGLRAGSGVQPVVLTSLENYTRQVVPYENFGSWPVTAQAAQAVAARSYGAWYLTHPVSSRYDICDTTTCQVFGGLGAESANTKAGVAASAGVVIAISGKPIRAEFGSSNGGWTVASDVVHQIAQADPWEGKLAPSAYTWRASVSAATIQSKWPTIGTFTRLVVTSRDGHGWWGGRVLAVRIEGTAGSVTRTGDQLRATLGLRSNYLTVADSPAALFRDQSGDGRPDFLSRASDGSLFSTRSSSATTFGTPVKVGTTAWGAYKHVFSAGLFGSDRYADVMTVDATGTLRYHTSYGSKFAETKVLGTGFGAYNRFVTLDNFTGKGVPSILARRTSDGAVVRFDGNGVGGLVSTTPKVITPSGWGGNAYNQWFGAGDITKDGLTDLVVREADGDIIAWKGNGTGGFSGSVKIATWKYFVTMTSPGDVNKDGLSDVVARYSDGRTRLFSTRTPTGWGPVIALATAPSGDRLLS